MMPGEMPQACRRVDHGRNTAGIQAHPSARMSREIAETVAFLFQMYAGAGLLFALVFLPVGAHRVDPHLAGSPVAVRALILPGVALFWPLLAWRWARR
jgi:hypothetical protein